MDFSSAMRRGFSASKCACRSLSSQSSSAIHAHGSTAGARSGLYGFEVLKTAKGFRRFVDEAIERSQELVSRMPQLRASEEIIGAMDEISNTVCTVVDSAEFCRNTHPDREFVEEANLASIKINEYIHCLNTNHILYSAVLKAEKECAFPTKEAERMAHSLRVDFEKGGIHLCPRKLERVNQLNSEIALLSREYVCLPFMRIFSKSCFPNTEFLLSEVASFFIIVEVASIFTLI